jgi:glycosyltransferase involved in cell wall biosynthesis
VTEAPARPAPRVSVCIPVYNGERYIGETIRSVLDQTFTDFEILVSDNASTDGTVEAVLGIGDPRIRLLRNDVNLGPGRNYNVLLREARGRYVKVLSADDYLMPDSLERMVAVFEDRANDGVVLVTARREVVGEEGRHLTSRGFRRVSGRVAGSRAIRLMVRSGTNLIGETSGTLLRSEMISVVGTFLDEAPYCVDMDYWFRMLEHGDLYAIPETLTAYRVSRGAWSLDVLDTQAADVIALLERTRARGIAGLTDADVRRGRRAVRLSVALRRAFYAMVLAIPARRR